MKEKNNLPASHSQWKEWVIFGIVNIVLVLLWAKWNGIFVNGTLMLLIITCIGTTIKSIIANWRSGFNASAIGCIAGLLLNCFAAILYVYKIIMSIKSVLGT